MRAVQIHTFGGPDVLTPVDLAEPEAGPGDVVVESEAVGVLYLDTQLRAGWGRDYFPLELPTVLGVSAAGTVRAVGPDVDLSWLGARVLTHTSGPGHYRGGGYAERVVGVAAMTHRLPDGVSAAAALTAQDGVMAVDTIGKAGLRAGDSALVTAASGSIGIWLVPMLHAAGVRVIAAAHGEEKTRLAAERGADVVLDYRTPNWTADLEPSLDAVFDGAGGELGRTAFDLLAPGGRFFSYGSAAGEFPDVAAEAARRDIRVHGIDEAISLEAMSAAQGEALRLLADGEVEPVIGQQVPLERAAQAHRAIEERRVLGRTVLTL